MADPRASPQSVDTVSAMLSTVVTVASIVVLCGASLRYVHRTSRDVRALERDLLDSGHVPEINHASIPESPYPIKWRAPGEKKRRQGRAATVILVVIVVAVLVLASVRAVLVLSRPTL